MLEMQAWSLGWEDPWRRKWQPTLVFLPGESHGQRSLTWGHRESDTIEHTYTAYEKPDKDSAMSDRDAHCDFEKHFPLLCNIIFSNYQRVPAGFGLKKLKLMITLSISKVIQFSSVQFSRSVVSNSLRPYGLQHVRPPCPSPTPGVHSNSCPLTWWCHPTISSCHPLLLPPSTFPASGSF